MEEVDGGASYMRSLRYLIYLLLVFSGTLNLVSPSSSHVSLKKKNQTESKKAWPGLDDW